MQHCCKRNINGIFMPFEKGKSGNEKTMFSSENQPSNNGRKPKSFRMFNDKMKAEGYEPLTKEELINCYALIFTAEEEKIQEIANDETQPLALRLIIQEMTDERTRSRALIDFRDYMFGKAKEEIKQETEMKLIWNEEKTYQSSEIIN